MPLQPSNPGAQWPELAGSGAASAAQEAGFAKDVNNDWYPTVLKPFTGALLDLGDGFITLTDISAGYPPYVTEMKLAYLGGHYIAYT